jgi:hypothetical protein
VRQVVWMVIGCVASAAALAFAARMMARGLFPMTRKSSVLVQLPSFSYHGGHGSWG